MVDLASTYIILLIVKPLFVKLSWHARFLDALASLKTMFKIQWFIDVFKISRLQSFTEY